MDLSKIKPYIPVTDHINEDRKYFTDGIYFIKQDYNKIRGHNEAEILSKLKVGMWPELYKHYEEANCYTIIMEYIEGETLEYKHLTPDRKHFIITEVMKIIYNLMGDNIVHGDINTSNIIVNKDMVYLIDFEMGREAINDYTDIQMLYNRVITQI